MHQEQTTVEVSLWAREAELSVLDRMRDQQLGEAFDEPMSVGRFAADEARRLIVVGLFVAVVLAWAAILSN